MYFKDQNISQGSSQVAKNKVFLKGKIHARKHEVQQSIYS